MHRKMFWWILLATAAFMAAFLGGAAAQTVRVPPRPGFAFVDERTVHAIVVERWVSQASPAISPAGLCECVTVVYAGGRQVLAVGPDVGALQVADISGQDIDGDGSIDIVTQDWSGGAHCCFTTTIYSLDAVPSRAAPRKVLKLDAGNCGGNITDLDGDGRFEVVTCDDQWANAYCSFGASPMPTVVLAYDPARRLYEPDTPRFARFLRDDLADTTKEMPLALANNTAHEAGPDRCAVLGPALTLMFQGRVDDGVALIRHFYDHSDQDAFVRETLDRVRASPLWTDR